MTEQNDGYSYPSRSLDPCMVGTCGAEKEQDRVIAGRLVGLCRRHADRFDAAGVTR